VPDLENSAHARVEEKLLRRVFGIRVDPGGTLRIPLQHTWKAFSRLEFVALGVVLPCGYVLSNPTSANQEYYASYVVISLLLYVVLAVSLIVRRSLVTPMHSGMATLFQERQSHSLLITTTLLGSSRRKTHAYVFLDGVQFPLATRIGTSRKRRLAAVQVLRQWTSPKNNVPLPSSCSPTAFLALIGDVSISSERTSLRAIWSSLSHYVFMANGVAVLAIVFFSMFATPSTQTSATAFGVRLALAWLVNLGVVIYLQRCKPTIAITPGKWAEVNEHGDVYKCFPWQARFVVARPEPPVGGDDQIGPSFPYIELKYGNRSLTVHSSSRYDADELENFAERMNHYLWGGVAQPQDPAKVWSTPPIA
jgi:hypothetical protein